MNFAPVGTALHHTNSLAKAHVAPALNRAVSSRAMSASAAPAPQASSLEQKSKARAVGAVPSGSVGDPHPWHERFDIVEDRLIHTRYMSLYDRVIKFTPEDAEPHSLHYDVVGHPNMNFSFAVAFPFHPATESTPAQVTVVREYAQGPNCLMYCLPTGGCDPRKHASLRECAEAEMAEEAMLVGGEVVALLPDDHPGQSELKWSRNSFKPFLIINPQPAPSGHAARDAEEHTIEVHRVTIPELRKLVTSGQMMLPSVYACFLGLEVLEARKLI